MHEGLQISAFQERLLKLALEISLALTGGKGGAKTFALCLLALQHCEQFKEFARVLILRQSFPSLEQVITHINTILASLYGGKVAQRCFNKSDMTYTLPMHGGARIELGHLDGGGLRYWGRATSMLCADEIGTFTVRDIENLDMIRTNMRVPTGVIPREIWTANPGGAAHAYLEKHVIRPDFQPFERDGKLWMNCPSTYQDNPFIDQESQRQAILSLPDKELAQALLSGDWKAVRGGNFFGKVWQPGYSIIEPWAYIPNGVKAFWSIDHGGGQSTTACMLCGIAEQTVFDPNDGSEYPAGSRFLIDEVDDATPDYMGTLGWTISRVGELVKQVSDEYQIKPKGWIDPQVVQEHGHSSTLLQEWNRCGLSLQPWKRHGREARGNLMRQYMSNAAAPHNRTEPGLYVTENCPGWLATVPMLPVDKRRRTDVDTKASDHHYDASAGLWFRGGDGFKQETLYL